MGHHNLEQIRLAFNLMTRCPKLLPLMNEIEKTIIIPKGGQKRDESELKVCRGRREKATNGN